MFVNISNQNEKFGFEFAKNAGLTGMAFIENLLQKKPLTGPGTNPSSCYNIYRDAGKKNCINYIDLSNSIENLRIDDQPLLNGYRALYFNMDNEMNYGM
jgi:hypothetical protein